MNIAFIPARCGSKSVPLKNIKIFCGKPLVYWCLKELQNSKNIDAIFVATDCEKIELIVNSFSFSKVVVYKREKQNAYDESSTESVMMEFIGNNSFNNDDLFMLVQATSPLTQTKDFDQAFKIMEQEKSDSLLTCVRVKRFFWDNNLSLNYDYKERPRRQDFQGTLMENGAFYINSIINIKNSNNRLSGKISIYEMEGFTAVEIDEKDDWLIAEMLMQRHVLSKNNTTNIKMFLSDVDGTLTDSGMYYGNNGEEFKKFNTRDGKGFEILRKYGIKTGIITSEDNDIVLNRANKLKINYLWQGVEHNGKVDVVEDVCKQEGINFNEVAYIGDDINCKELLQTVGIAACPQDAALEIRNIPGIIITSKKGGGGAVREFSDYICQLQK
jgi:N-acylneuraminate cytidylyltransferase